MRPTVRSVLLFAVAAAMALGPSACGKDKKSGGDSASASTSAPTSASTSASTSGSASAGGKPEVTVPSGNPPTTLEKKDLIVGKGAEAASGQKVSVQYVGVAYSTKKQFDASWDRGQPFSFTLGGGEVIKGWDQGVPGMKVGGRRQLVIPPDLAYGPSGYPPVIGPNETLVFVIDLVGVNQ
jgi:peptidylprolyl isomerase